MSYLIDVTPLTKKLTNSRAANMFLTYSSQKDLDRNPFYSITVLKILTLLIGKPLLQLTFPRAPFPLVESPPTFTLLEASSAVSHFLQLSKLKPVLQKNSWAHKLHGIGRV